MTGSHFADKGPMLRTPYLVVLALLAAACSGGGNGLLGGAAKKDGAQDKKTDVGGGDGGLETEDGEDIKTTEPVQVSGTLLTAECGRAEEERAVVVGAAADAVVFGCRYAPAENVALSGIEVVRGTDRVAASSFAPAGKTWTAVFAAADVATISAFDLTLVPTGKGGVRVRAQLLEGTLPNQPKVFASCGAGESLIGNECLKPVRIDERVLKKAGVPVNIVYVPQSESTPRRESNGGAFFAFKAESCDLESCKLDAGGDLLADGTLPIFKATKEDAANGDTIIYGTANDLRKNILPDGFKAGAMAFCLLPLDRENAATGLYRVCRARNKKVTTVYDLTLHSHWKTSIVTAPDEWTAIPEAQGCGALGVAPL